MNDRGMKIQMQTIYHPKSSKRHIILADADFCAISIYRENKCNFIDTLTRWNFDLLLFWRRYMKNKFVARHSHLSFGSRQCIRNFNIVIRLCNVYVYVCMYARRYIATCTFLTILYFGTFSKDIVPLTLFFQRYLYIFERFSQKVATSNLWNRKKENKRKHTTRQ